MEVVPNISEAPYVQYVRINHYLVMLPLEFPRVAY